MNGDIVKLLHNWIRADRYDILQDGSDNIITPFGINNIIINCSSNCFRANKLIKG